MAYQVKVYDGKNNLKKIVTSEDISKGILELCKKVAGPKFEKELGDFETVTITKERISYLANSYKKKPCYICGEIFLYKHGRKLKCDTCIDTKKRGDIKTAYRIMAEENRRYCKACNVILKIGSKAIRCPSCAKERQLRLARESMKALKANGGKPGKKTMDIICMECKKVDKNRYPHAKYCSTCYPIVNTRNKQKAKENMFNFNLKRKGLK